MQVLHLPRILLVTLCLAALAAVERVEVLPLTDRIVMVRIVDGHVVHHGIGQKRDQERVVVEPVNLATATAPATWTLASAQDPAFAKPVHPSAIGRKSKGVDWAWMIQRWDQQANRAVNASPDHATEHCLYLELPLAMRRGAAYELAAGDLPSVGTAWSFTFDEARTRSEAVHVDLLGYVTDAPAKYAYVYHWLGDRGGLDLGTASGRLFRLIEVASGREAFRGAIALRARAGQPETAQLSDTPGGNYEVADVWECDFSGFATPGRYVVAVDGIGCSFPFAIGDDVMREAYRATARALYHNRSGIELKMPFTTFERPAPHHPALTPGFAGKLVYTRSRFVDWRSTDNDKADRPAIEAGIAGPLAAWGWYQDAGDWDGYWTHLNVASCLLLAYELAPTHFVDRDLNIPESGNGVPDILDEAAWLPRFCQRLRAELLAKGYGSGGIGLRVCGDHFGGDGEGVPSYRDVNRQWIVSGEDPWSTYRYAAVAAQLVYCLGRAGVGDPQGVDWLREARESYAWAVANTRAGDESKQVDGAALSQVRAYAAAALFRATREAAYEERLLADTASLAAADELQDLRRWGPWLYALGGGGPLGGPEAAERLRGAVLASCQRFAIDTPAKRALRWGGHWAFPMLVGQQTTPWILEGMVGHALCREREPERARAFRAAVHTTADWVLGTNPLNMTWITGVGPRHPNQVFDLDVWYNGKGVPHPGIIPYGPWRQQKEHGQGPWDTDWPNDSVHPAIAAWPGGERWFDNRNCPMSSEFTIHQNICYAAAVFGWLCAPAGR